MELLSSITVRKTNHSRIREVDFNDLEFGKHVSDHMLVCDYSAGRLVSPADDTGQGWERPQILPFTNLSLSPSTLALHYGQTVFEGMKAFRMKDGRINIFRMDRHYERFARSLDRLCMAVPPRDIFMEGLVKLVDLDRGWIPGKPGGALYIRPFVYASEARFGIKISDEFRFIIFTGPVPELYARPIRVKVETGYVRAAKGGTGFAKCGGNYGAAYYPTKIAREQGYDQVLWTDAKQNRFIEESGMMNVMFVLNDVLVTPPVSDTILDGVTRDSLLTLARQLGFPVEERPVSVEELAAAFREKEISEAFGVGTAAVVAPIGTIHINGTDYDLPAYNRERVLFQLKHKLAQIRCGDEADLYGWNFVL
jgi:branched-chain amino acid aminotransferase